MPSIEDSEFGTIAVRKLGASRSMRATVSPSGSLRITVPAYTPVFMIKRMIASSRSQLRELLQQRPEVVIADGAPIGKSHSMLLRRGGAVSAKREGLRLVVTLPNKDSMNDPAVTAVVRSAIISILRREAKAHLPKRIEYLAQKYGYEYTSLRFTHASSRWGSCNSKKAISLNIALMNLPFELIDYVLLHELSHTVHMNHSKEFWSEVSRSDPEYKLHRSKLKGYNPNV